MTTNEASRVTDAAKELIRIVQKRSYSTLVYSPENEEAFNAACVLEVALTYHPVASKIDRIHGDKREVIINALCASSNWMRGYAESFVDDFVDGKAEYVAKGDLSKLADRWKAIRSESPSSDDLITAWNDLLNLINQAEPPK